MARVELGKRTGSFSQGISTTGKRTIYVAGHVGTDESGEIVSKTDVGAQTRQIFKNIAAVLAEGGATLQDVVKITTYMVDMSRYSEFSTVRAEVFDGKYPASAAVGVAALLLPEYLIEIDAIAVVDE